MVGAVAAVRSSLIPVVVEAGLEQDPSVQIFQHLLSVAELGILGEEVLEEVIVHVEELELVAEVVLTGR